ncbi:MAG: cupin domain-containing protein [Rhodoferax sp.]
MSKTPITSIKGNPIYVANLGQLQWVDASRPGLRLAAVHENRETGRFLGFLGFETFSSSGLHQHVDIAFSYMLSGGLTDYAGTTVAGQMGINLPGATHDATSYMSSLMASRLDGPVLYAPGVNTDESPHLHAGGRIESFVNPRPEISPDVSLTLADLPAWATAIAGCTRQMICDYSGTKHDFRNVSLTLIPGTTLPPFKTKNLIEIFVIGGGIQVNGKLVLGGGFCVIEPNTQVHMKSGFGAQFIAWSEGRIDWEDTDRSDLFGF